MHKRFVSKLVLMGMALTLLSGCGSGSADTSAEGAQTESTQTTIDASGKITLAIWDSAQEPGLKTICNEFTEETGIEVDVQVTPWEQYWTMLEAGATGGVLPDVSWMHVKEVLRYQRAGMLLNLDDYIAQSDEIDLSNYYDDITEIYSYEGSQYGIPKDVDTIALWYNKTHFDEVGLAYPDNTWTWETLKEAAATLTTDEHYGIGMRILNDQEGVYNVVYSTGGYIIDESKTKSGFDDPATIAAYEYVVDFVKDGTSPDNTVTSENDLVALFEAGSISMAMMGSWSTTELTSNEYVHENAAVAIMPMAEDGTRVSIYNGLAYAIAETSSNPDAAWKLVEYLCSEKGQARQAELGVTMSAYMGQSDAWANTGDGIDLSAYIEVMDDTLVYYPNSTNTTAWEDMAKASLVDAWTGADTVENVCKSIAETMNQYLSEE